MLAGAGDLNGDGHADVAVAEPASASATPVPGVVYVYLGGGGGLATMPTVFAGVAPGDFFGAALAGGGDTNGDGYADIFVAPGTAVDLFAGGPTCPSSTPSLVLPAPQGTQALGEGMSTGSP